MRDRPGFIKTLAIALGTCFCLTGIQPQDLRLPIRSADVFGPVFLYVPVSNGGSLITDPEGAVHYFYRTGPGNEGSGNFVYEDVSYDGGESWYLEKLLLDTGKGSRSEVTEVNPYSGEIYMMYTRGGGRMIRSQDSRSTWSEEIRLPFRVTFTTGSFIWLREEESTGFHRLLAAVPAEAGVVTYYSDDDGKTWYGPSNQVSAPDFPGRWDNPAGSPQMIEFDNGKIWMLTRNSQDHLWESFSDDWGKSWTDPRPSRFVGVFSNVRLKRIPDGRLLIIWLNSMPRSGVTRDGSFHNTTRDVLHAAISEDDGRSWIGFREVMLGARRHELVFSHLPAYDAGVHHQKFAVTRDNKVIVFSGQDDASIGYESQHRQAVIFDLGWLYERSRDTDFSQEYEGLCVFKLSKERYGVTNYYSRVLGATLIAHPTRPYRKVLQLGREKCDWVFNEQDGACWNFPAGKAGQVSTRILLREGFKGGLISLTNCFYNPSDNQGDSTAMFVFEVPEDGKINVSTALQTDRWYDIRLEWNGCSDEEIHNCRVFIDDVLQPERLKLRNPCSDGLCYVRLRSTAEKEDLAGFLVESLHAEIQ